MKALILPIILLLTIPSYRIHEYQAETPTLKVVIDASKDGGVWWSPQTEEAWGLDPQKEHQGKRLADYLRSRGWQVTEIRRGESLADKLNGASIVVRMNVFEPYNREEALVYKEFVTNGGKLLLVKGYVRQGEEDRDLVAMEFGIRFEGAIKTPEIKRWSIHRLTKGLKPLPFKTGSVVTQSPKETVPIAYLDNEQLVMGLVPCGKGRIIFLSTIFPLLEVHQPFTKRLFNELARE